MTLKKRLDRVSADVATLDEFAIDTLSRAATWTAPAVPAVLAYGAMIDHLHAGPTLAALSAVSIELMGLGAVSNMLNAAEYNRHADEAERLRMRPYAGMTAAYVGVVVVTVLGLKIAPQTLSWLALLALSMLTLLAAVSFTQRRQLAALLAPIHAQQERQQALDEERHRGDLRAAKRQAKRSNAHSEPHPMPSIEDANAARVRKAESRQARMVELLRAEGPKTTAELCEILEVSPNTVRKDLQTFNGTIAGDGRTGWSVTK